MTALRLARGEDLPKLLPLVAAFHSDRTHDQGHAATPEQHEAALAPLLAGNPLGVVYLIGPRMAPIGYVVISFGWSVALGGMVGTVDQVYLRASVRGRGIGHEVLSGLRKALVEAGLKALHIHLGAEDEALQRFFQRLHFTPQDGQITLTRVD